MVPLEARQGHKVRVSSHLKNNMQIELNEFQKFTMSYWLQARIAEIPSRDVIDMLNDTLWLAELLQSLVKETSRQ